MLHLEQKINFSSCVTDGTDDYKRMLEFRNDTPCSREVVR